MRKLRTLGELESAIMDFIWSSEEAVSVREIRDGLATQREWAYTTVLTVVDNLHRKGWLNRSPRGRAYVYRAVANRESYAAELMETALEASKDRDATFLHFVGSMSDDDVKALQGAIRRLKNRR